MKNTAYLAFALLGLIWGTNFMFMKWAVEWISPAQTVLLRMLFGFLPLLIYALSRRCLSWSHLRHAHHFLVMALLATVICYYFYAKGTTLLLSSVAGLLSGAIPLFTFVCAYLFLREEKLNGPMTAGVLLGFVGVLLIARPWASGAAAISVPGVMYMVLGSLSVGCSFVYAKRFLTGLNISPVALCTYQIGLALVVIAVVSDWSGIERITQSPKAMLGVSLGLGLLGTGVAYILYYFIVDRLGAVVAASVTYIPPVVALMIGILVAGEPMHGMDLLAIGAILAGVYLLQVGRRRGQAMPLRAAVIVK
ncbi:DMT family transporter [Xanthomonas sp. WHRI 1810A]|uniref:DMT family transporter n=1 Tax=Xanthomonas sp. WHRI 1810A TaxID=3161565 RepID=UPI0032E9278C